MRASYGSRSIMLSGTFFMQPALKAANPRTVSTNSSLVSMISLAPSTAARSLPQLPIKVDGQGFLVAQQDFNVPVGPSYFERDSRNDYQEGQD